MSGPPEEDGGAVGDVTPFASSLVFIIGRKEDQAISFANASMLRLSASACYITAERMGR